MIGSALPFSPSADAGAVRDSAVRMADRLPRIKESLEALQGDVERLSTQLDLTGDPAPTWVEVFNGYIGVLAVAFIVTLLATPLCRALAVQNGIIDRPNARKMHTRPIAYLGGLAVYVGIMCGILASYLASAFGSTPAFITFHATDFPDASLEGLPMPVPPWVVLGISVIMLIGLLDDVWGLPPRIKVAGQLLAAAFLAYSEVGTRLAAGLLSPTLGQWIGNPDLRWVIDLSGSLSVLQPIFGAELPIDVIYWSGTLVIAVFVLGACNAANLIDGLDGLLSGTTAIATLGLLAISIMMIFDPAASGPRDGQRIVLCMAVCGACLGFLPHNFNPATIFLGDCGSLLLGFVTIVIVLTLGDTGRTDLVIAGLIVYAIPIIDTTLAIIRRKMAGKKMSDADSDHLHHMLKRAFGVKGAVFTLYGIGLGFAVLGVLIAASGARMVYTLALLFAAFITFYSIKIARIKQVEEQMAARYESEPAYGDLGAAARTSDFAPANGVRPAPAGPAADGSAARSTATPAAKAAAKSPGTAPGSARERRR